MVILGIHKDPWHNSGAAIVADGSNGTRMVNIAEERLDRVKDSRAFPERSIKACMADLGIGSLDAIDVVVLDYICNGTNWREDYYRTPCRTDVLLADIPPEKIHFVNHHLAHAHAVFYSSPFDEAAILIVDGRGSHKETQSLFIGTPDGIRLLESTAQIGVGLLYAAVTHLIGFGLLQEGKTMGLAPYGAGINKTILQLPQVFSGIVTDYSSVCVEDSYELKALHAPVQSFEDKTRAAFEVQMACEAAMIHLARHARTVTGLKNLCISGGVALNSVANYKIAREGIFEQLFMNPAASDTGIPLGAAMFGYHTMAKRKKNYGEVSAFLGPAYSASQIEAAVRSFTGYDIIREGAKEHAVRLLADNRIVGMFHGRSEMGPRALGHRSILMSPLHAENKDVLNSRVKHREAFRPFAPAILEEYTQEFFEIDRASPYMLLVPHVRPDKRVVIPAVTHVDGTGRLQTIDCERNGFFYRLIQHFHARTGVPVLLNTSFNVAGEPIVESPEDCIRCFLGTEIDALLLEEVLLVKRSAKGVGHG